jgi:uncharacterized membrane protein YfcA
MTPEIIIAIVAFIASLLTFFSGFGLGTLLLPVFALFYNMPTAILLTACVHFLNNLFKFSLVFRFIHWRKGLLFLLYAMPASFIGAWLLHEIGEGHYTEYHNLIGPIEILLSPVNTSLGILMVLFGLWELFPHLQKLDVTAKWFGLFAFLSGLIGGFSGHQGALRTIVLSQAKLDKQAFVATGIFIACLVDLSRIPVYFQSHEMNKISLDVILPAVVPAFLGAWIGNRFLKKIELVWLKWIVGVFLIAMGVLIGIGIF